MLRISFHHWIRNSIKCSWLLAILFFWAPASSQAQIVLTSDEIPSTSGVMNEYYINTEKTDQVDVGHSGDPQTWDFSQGSKADSVAELVVDRDDTPFGEDFPEANVVYHTDGINIAGIDTAAGFMYMRLDENEFALLGAASQTTAGKPTTSRSREQRAMLLLWKSKSNLKRRQQSHTDVDLLVMQNTSCYVHG